MSTTRDQEETARCILCGGGPRFIGIFVPYANVARRLAGQPRAIAYALCGRCAALADKLQRIEACLYASLSVQ